jgi:hypothetical protein
LFRYNVVSRRTNIFTMDDVEELGIPKAGLYKLTHSLKPPGFNP